MRAARARAERNKEASLEIREGLATLCEPGAVYELRILDASCEGVVSGYFDDLGKLAAAVASFDGKVPVYITLNPCVDAVLAASNRP